MTTPTSTRSLREQAADNPYTEHALDATNQALESTRQFAAQAFDKAGDKMRDLRSSMKDLASKSANTLGDAGAAAQERATRYAQATGRYVAEEPLKAALIAAAVGAAVAAIVLAMRRNRDY
jgi:ElaB/YqjD/DUF883 family membrane-anchored ribosome-binding protein